MGKFNPLVIPEELTPDTVAVKKVEEFLSGYESFETKNKVPLMVFYDKRSDAYYIICHMEGKVLSQICDINAVLDPNESEDYKLNRDIYTDNYAYKLMEIDAENGRSFEDIVVEYETSYKQEKPLKVFGGQHRIKAITESAKKNVNNLHGVRIFFNLTVEQKVNIAMVNNTSITVPNDLLDRMQEELLGTDLRNWCQTVGLLDKGQNFADKRSQDGIPTVRIARTLIVNFYKGKNSKDKEYHLPVVCTTGPELDKEYQKIRNSINWSDESLIRMGREFARLHKLQRQCVLTRTSDKHAEFANKAIHPSVAASWAYAAGLFQGENSVLEAHYQLAGDKVSGNDPLNAKVLSNARVKGIDNDTYRGLGSRINSDELGRMLEVFILQARKAPKRGITKNIATAAIQSFIAKHAKYVAEKAMKKI